MGSPPIRLDRWSACQSFGRRHSLSCGPRGKPGRRIVASVGAGTVGGAEVDRRILDPSTYYGKDAVVVITATGRMPDPKGRMPIDRRSYDHTLLTETEFPEAEHVESPYLSIPELIVTGAVDSAVWHQTSSSPLLLATGLSLHPLRHPSPPDPDGLSRAAFYWRKADRTVATLMDEVLAPDVLQRIQREVIAGERTPQYRRRPDSNKRGDIMTARREALLLGLDVGTTTVKAAVFSLDSPELPIAVGRAQSVATSPRPGWSEADPDAVTTPVRNRIREALGSLDGNHVRAVGISGTACGAWLLANPRPVRPAILWDDELLALASIEALTHLLPELLLPLTTDPLLSTMAADVDLPADIPVALGTTDIIAGCVGGGAVEPGYAVSILGTSANSGVVTREPEFEPRDVGIMAAAPGDRWVRTMLNTSGSTTLDWAARLFADGDVPALLPYLAAAGVVSPFVDA